MTHDIDKSDMLISGAQAAQLIGVSTTTFYKLAKEEEGLSAEPTAGQITVWSMARVCRWADERDEATKKAREDLIAAWRSRRANNTQ